MRIVGLTGGIGSGKTIVADMFSELGIAVIDTDQIAHKLTLPGSSVLKKIIESFGSEYLLENQQLDRKLLAETIFNDAQKKSDLESILHPEIKKVVEKELSLYSDNPYVIVVVPLLFETDFKDMVDLTLVIDAPEETQISRTKKRDGKTTEEIKNIIKQQYPRQQRLHSADDIIYNSATLTDLRNAVISLHTQYLGQL